MSEFHSKDINYLYSKLKTSDKGLSQPEASLRLKTNGRNELPSKKPLSRWFIFFSQFNNALIYILLGAGVVSFLLGDIIDAGIIFAAVVLNTIIGFVQELKASEALSKLKSLVEHKAFVFREGHEIEIESKILVIGDVIDIKSGNKIPADARLINSINLQVNESSLTGESIPSTKDIVTVSEGTSLADRECMVYAGTVVARGSGRAVVVATGIDTEIGQIAQMVSRTQEESTPLQKRLRYFSKQLGFYILGLSLVLFVIGILQKREILEMFLVGVALAVAAIPEGLTVAVTVVLTVGMKQILKRKSLVRKLIAAETLGSTTVICTDKTGTLTEGNMHVAHIVVGENEYELDTFGSRQNIKEAKIVSLALQASMMCNDALIENPEEALSTWKLIGESTDTALFSAAVQSGLSKEKLLEQEPFVDELPFSSDLKYMITLHKKGKNHILYEKGAPERLLEKSSHFFHKGKLSLLNEQEKKKLIVNYKKLTSKGLRVIGVAYKDLKDLEWEKGDKWSAIDYNLNFIAFIALKDPLRAEAKETISLCRKAGIRPVIITGDYHLTAKAIAEELGFKLDSDKIMTGDGLEKLSDEKLLSMVSKVDVYARVNPHHKLRIVRALQKKGEVVAMTGDGINDSPALKAADIGISLGTGTDIAKETSDIVLLDNNFKTIVAAIRQGRIIFDNIRKVITFLLSDSFSQLLLVAGSIFLGFPLALLPAQILWMNIIQDGMPHFALAMEKDDGDVMSRKPIKKDEPILNKEMKLIIFFAGLSRDFLIFFIFIYMFKSGRDITFIRTFIFASLTVSSLLNIYSIRSLMKPIWHSNPFSNKYLNIAVFFSFILLLAGIYWPPLQNILSVTNIHLNTWLLIFGLGLTSVFFIETVKYSTYKKFKKIHNV